MEETQPKDLAKEAEITTSSKARSSPDGLSSNSGCRDVNGEDVNAATSDDWFLKTFIDPYTFFIKEDVKDKLLQFKWLTGSFGLTGPNKTVNRGHLFLTVEEGYKRERVLQDLSDEFGSEVTQYTELLEEKNAPTFKFLSSPQTTPPRNSPECGCGISFVEPSAEVQSSCVNQGDGINPSKACGTLMIFGTAGDNSRCQYALTCYHVAACNDFFFTFDKHNLKLIEDLTNEANSEFSPVKTRHFYWHRRESSPKYSSGDNEHDGENISGSGSSSLDSAAADGNNFYLHRTESLTEYSSSGNEHDGENISESDSSSLDCAADDCNNDFHLHRTESLLEYSSSGNEHDGENISESGSSKLGSAAAVDNNNEDTAQKLGEFAEGYFQKDCDIFVVKLESDLQPNCQSKVAKPATHQMILNLRRQNWESNKTFAVQKFGYTTGKTGGHLRKCCFDYCVEKNGKNTLVFSNAYVVQGSNPSFMKGGDSGALVMFEHTDKECYGFAYGVCEVDDDLNLPSDYNEENDDEEDGTVFQHDSVNDSKFICFDLAVAFEKLKLVKKPCFGACVKGESEEEGREEE